MTWAAQAAADAETLVNQVTQATKNLNYEGTFVYTHETNIDAMLIVHKVENSTEYERLISLSGPTREVTRDGDRVTCVFGEDRYLMVEKRRPEDFIGLALSEPVKKISEYYSFKLLPDDRVAERPTKVIRITPVTADRYSYQLWIDSITNLLLKSTVLSNTGAVLEQVMFTAVEIGKPIDATKLRASLGGDFKSVTNTSSRAETDHKSIENLKVGWIPHGFALKNSYVQRMADSHIPVQHLVYSDGLAMVSVFVEALTSGSPPLKGYSSMGAINAFSRINARHQITVVGEIPQTTVRKIAASVVVQ